MNIEQANAIALPEILQKIGSMPVRQKGGDIWYNSPFRDEKTASFHVDVNKNKWFDFGIARGGDTVAFVRAYLQSHNEDSTTADALRWIDNMAFSTVSKLSIPKPKPIEPRHTLALTRVSELEHRGLINFLQSRGIPLSLAKKYLKELIVSNANSGRKFHTIGLATESDGYELRNKVFKGCIGAKSISFIRGSRIPAIELHVFEGMMDFLSAVVEQKNHHFMGDVIILNSVTCLPQSFPYIKNYVYRSLYTWLDNDEAGKSATEDLKELAEAEGILTFQAMNKTYAQHKDVNAWHMDKNNPKP